MLKVELIGNIGADAEMKDFQGNKFVAFRVAHSSKYKDSQGYETESTTWVDVTLNDTESKVIPFLKQGVKVFVRGNASLRMYSSPKDKMMKAGLKVSAWEIELCGAQSDDVPSQLIDPSNGALVDVTKHYWCNRSIDGMKKDEFVELIDKKGHSFMMNYGGFVVPFDEGSQAEQDAEQAGAQAESKQEQNKSSKAKK
ncbi:MAG: single-stranded DNA-binding protein [Paludibacteraceae bacterium]|nr:single-stranded DNA-binding protein [Paludibacteraceae bacterium]